MKTALFTITIIFIFLSIVMHGFAFYYHNKKKRYDNTDKMHYEYYRKAINTKIVWAWTTIISVIISFVIYLIFNYSISNLFYYLFVNFLSSVTIYHFYIKKGYKAIFEEKIRFNDRISKNYASESKKMPYNEFIDKYCIK